MGWDRFGGLPRTYLDGLGWYVRSGMGIEGLGWVRRTWDWVKGPSVYVKG